MWQDEILEEIHRVREEHAKSFNYDLATICKDLRKQEAKSGRQIITKPLKQTNQQPNTALETTA
ncbi:MAG: hypothetical protein AAFQ80_08795 [Cyanobacteria bacterium J06621_8]